MQARPFNSPQPVQTVAAFALFLATISFGDGNACKAAQCRRKICGRRPYRLATNVHCVLPAHSAVSTVIQPDEARQHVGEQVAVTFLVQKSKFAHEPDRVYLDSELDYRDPRNLGVLIEAESLPRFAGAGIAEPHKHYFEKTIRVAGKLFLRDGDIFIRAEKPADITVIEPTKKST